jgi:DNA (cytosine-5)-methyltransferase 1
MNVIDFFSGCGGLSYGFVQVGYDVIIGIDNDESALKTFEYNHPNSKGLLLDLFRSDFISELDKEVKSRTVDIIVGGPPCQGFSLTGSRDEKDKRNLLFRAMFEAVDKYKPKVVVIENVPGLKTLYGGFYYKQIIREFDSREYQWEAKILYAPEFGIPQIRKRLVFIATRNDLKRIVHPKAIITDSSKYITSGDAISDLPSLEDGTAEDKFEYTENPSSDYAKEMRRESEFIYNHVLTKHSQLVIDVISQVPEGGNYKDLPDGVGDSRKFNEAWTRYHRNQPSKTIDTGHRNHFHYQYNRVPTVRENARIQSFPDKFVFFGSKTEQYRQVGNAVPPKLGYYVAKTIKEQLEREKQ